MNRFYILLHTAILLFLGSCQHRYHSHYSVPLLLPVSGSIPQDSAVHYMIQPYKATLDSLMNEVIAYTEVDLTRGMPEGSLGNFVCDELLEYAKKQKEIPIDFCLLNNGGLRIPSIGKGNIMIRTIYELLPFENTLEVIEMDGVSCKRLLDEAAKQGGVPVSGVRFKITNEQASEIIIGENSFDPQKKYFVLTNDYLANGGEEAMKNVLNRFSLNVKLRDSMIQQLRGKKANNQTIKTIKDGRILKI